MEKKTVVLDNNILQEQGNQKLVTKIKESNLLEKINNGEIELFISDAILKQRFAHLYEAKKENEYNLFLDFFNTYCSDWIINSAANIVATELEIIKQGLPEINVPTWIHKRHALIDLEYNSPSNIFKDFKAKENTNHSKDLVSEYKKSIKTILEQIKKIRQKKIGSYIPFFLLSVKAAQCLNWKIL